MNIEVFGSPTSISKDMAIKALRFYSERLMSSRLHSKLNIRLFFKLDLIKTDGLEASCVWEDKNIRAREFMVLVDSGLIKSKLLMSLAHEAVHIRQYATGQLKHYMRKTPDIKWLDTFVDDTKVPYHELPWEVEAWDLEPVLYRDFLKHKRAR